MKPYYQVGIKSSSDKLETLKVKASLVSYFRFHKKHDIVCVEFNYGGADVLSLDDDGNIYEVEVKVSVSDMRNEAKKYKHQRCKPEITNTKPYKYNYLAVPERMRGEATIFLKEKFPLFGLYVLRNGVYSSYGATGIDTVIKAKSVNPYWDYRTSDLKERAIKGMSNNLARVYSQLVDAERRLLPEGLGL